MNIGEEKQVKKRKTKAQLAKLREKEELKQLLANRVFRDYLWKVLSYCGVYRAPISHPQESFREIGRQDIGRKILEDIFEADKQAYVLMQEEANG